MEGLFCPPAGGASALLDTADPSSGNDQCRIVTDATNVYWTLSSLGSVMKIPLGGGVPTAVVSNQIGPYALAVDATHIYWTSREISDGAVFKKPK